jgi:hypothetical protein
LTSVSGGNAALAKAAAQLGLGKSTLSQNLCSLEELAVLTCSLRFSRAREKRGTCRTGRRVLFD